MSSLRNRNRHILFQVVIEVNMPIVAETPVRKKSREELDRLALARHLLKLEPLGVLSREICYQPIPTDDEDPGMFGAKNFKGWGVLPPRLFFIPKYHTLVHCYGDDLFYENNPEYQKGGISKECYVVEEFPRFLANYFAMEPTYQRVGLIPKYTDPLSLEAKRPPPMTKEEQKEASRAAKQVIKDRIAAHENARISRIRLVKPGENDGQVA